jgi:hypothetical protein
MCEQQTGEYLLDCGPDRNDRTIRDARKYMISKTQQVPRLGPVHLHASIHSPWQIPLVCSSCQQLRVLSVWESMPTGDLTPKPMFIVLRKLLD